MGKNQEFKTVEKGFLTFDPIVILRDILKRWLLILVAVCVMGVGTYIVTDATYTPSYRTRTTLVVSTRGSSATVYSNLTTTSNLASVFTEMANSSIFRKTILEQTGLGNFKGTISATAVEDTNLLTLQVTDEDPRTAFLVTQAILDHHGELTREIIGDVAMEVLQKPTVPTTPSNPLNSMGTMKKVMGITAVLMCLLVGWLSFSRDTVRSSKEARKKLNCSCLGSLPHEHKYKTLLAKIRRPKASILITNPATGFGFTETLRKICRRVEQRMEGRKSLMVVSLLENEGKSTVAVNLALAMAQKYPRVLLIDCDLQKPACAKLLHINWTGAGVGEVLRGLKEPADATVTDGRSGLHLLLEKNPYRNSGELIGSENMKRMMEWARANFDMVVLDLPPMSAVTDAESVMEQVDASLLVVRQNAAQTRALNNVISSLEKGKAKLLGCVMNDVHSTAVSSGQGYGGGYSRYGGYGRYGHYGHYGKYGKYGNYYSKKQG